MVAGRRPPLNYCRPLSVQHSVCVPDTLLASISGTRVPCVRQSYSPMLCRLSDVSAFALAVKLYSAEWFCEHVGFLPRSSYVLNSQVGPLYGVLYIVVVDVTIFSSSGPVLRGDHVTHGGVVTLNYSLFICGPCSLHDHLLNDSNFFHCRGQCNVFILSC